MIRFLYNVLFPLGLILFLPGYLIKLVRRGGYRDKFGQRLGFYDAALRQRLAVGKRVWIHAVSVGEVRIALKLSARMKRDDPDLCFALTTTTTTGFQLAVRHGCTWLEVLYTPLDFWPVMRRAFRVIHPRQIVLVEAEVWPNMVAFANARGISIALVNARLSPRSERRFLRFRFFVAPLFARLDLVCVQDPNDAPRFVALGVNPKKVRYTGSVKFDSDDRREGVSLDESTALSAEPHGLSALVLLGGSTHRGEEKLLGRLVLQLRREFPALTLFVAPRHTERVREVRAQLEELQLRVRLASEAGSSQIGGIDCLVLDTTGELSRWYHVATVVFVGKSFSARGGQNPIEPILAGKPVLFGPHMENFQTLARSLLAHEAAIQVRDETTFREEVARLLRSPELRASLVQRADIVLAPHRGATERTAAFLRTLG